MRTITIVVKNNLRRPLRSSLTILAVAIGVGAVVALVGIASGFEDSFLRLFKGAGVDIIVVRAGAQQRLTSTLDQRLGDRIARLRGVAAVFPALADVVSFDEYGLYGVLVQGWVPQSRPFEHLRIVSGRSLRLGDGKVALLGEILAKNLGKKPGDELSIFENERFKVVGIHKSTNVFEEGAIVVPLDQLQRLMDRKGQVTGFSIVLQDSSDSAAVERVRREVEASGNGLTAQTTEEHVKSISELQMAKAMAWLTSSIALLIGAFGVLNTMVMSVHERTREIGILRALGWGRRRVLRLILLESVVLSLFGAAVGVGGGALLVRVLTRIPTVSGAISGRLDPLSVVEGLLIALIVGVIGGLLPAIRAARMLPTAALRYE